MNKLPLLDWQTDSRWRLLAALFFGLILSFGLIFAVKTSFAQSLFEDGCSGKCFITLPPNLPAGNYTAVSFLSKVGSTDVIHTDVAPVLTADGSSACDGRCHVSLPTDLEAGSYKLTTFLKDDANGNVVAKDALIININGSITEVVGDDTTPREINLIEGTCQGDNCPSAQGEVCGPDKLKTAIGCVSTKPADLIKDLITLSIGIGGVVALIRMILGSYQMIMSHGNKDSIKEGRDKFVSALIGLIFIILAVYLMELVGLSILALPGFGR